MSRREKYKILKEKASQWRDKALDYQRRYEDILEENEKLVEENDDLQDRLISQPDSDHSHELELEQEIEKLRAYLEKYKNRYREARKRICELEKYEEETRKRILELEKYKEEERLLDGLKRMKDRQEMLTKVKLFYDSEK